MDRVTNGVCATFYWGLLALLVAPPVVLFMAGMSWATNYLEAMYPPVSPEAYWAALRGALPVALPGILLFGCGLYAWTTWQDKRTGRKKGE